MPKTKRFIEDEKRGMLRGRFTELQSEDIFKRPPVYNLCTLDHYYSRITKGGKKVKREKEGKNGQDELKLILYTKVLEKKKKLKNRVKKEPVVLTEADKHTVAEAIDKYILQRLPNRSKSSQENYSYQLQYWKEKFGDTKLSELIPIDIQNARDELGEGGERSNATLNRYLAAFSTVLGSCRKHFHWIETNPCSKIECLEEPDGRVRFLNPAEKKKLLGNCTGDLKDAVELSLYTGARKNEIWKLRWDSINWKKDFITFWETKNGKPRSLQMSETVREILQGRKKKTNGSNWVFPSEVVKDKPRKFEKSWRRALRESGVESFVYHDLRHTAASYLVMAGQTLRTVADILGHEDISQTFKYAHLSPAHLAGAMEALDKELSSM